MNDATGDPADRTLAEQEALATGRAWLYRGRVIPIISGGETPPDPAADPPAAEPPSEPVVRPEWLPEQYADEQAFANAHREAQRKITEQGNDLSRLREELESLSELVQEQPAQQSYGDASTNPLVIQYANAMGVDVETAAQALGVQAQLAQALFDQRMQEQEKQSSKDVRGLDPYLVKQMGDGIAAKHGADEAMQAKAFEIMEQHPLVAQRLQEIQRDPRATIGDLAPVVETAYELAKVGRVQAEQTSLAQQQATADLARQRKLDAETLSGTGTREASQDEQAALFARIKGMNTGGLRLGEQ